MVVVVVDGLDGPFCPSRSSLYEADVAEGGRKGWFGRVFSKLDLCSMSSWGCRPRFRAACLGAGLLGM